MGRLRVMLAALAVYTMGVFPLQAGTLDTIKERGSIKLGYRSDGKPFSFETDDGKPAGYSVELCRRVAEAVKDHLQLADLTVEFVQVTASNRLEMVENGSIDLECGLTTNTLSRQERVGFSQLIFITGAEMLIRRESGTTSLEEVAGRRIAVLENTTTERGLLRTLQRKKIEAEVVAVSSHDEGLAMLEEGTIDAYFGDRAVLILLGLKSKNPKSLSLSGRFYSYEPYALVMRKGDEAFRLVVDRALARLYRSGKVEGIYRTWFGETQPSDILQALFILEGLPE